jgi:ATP-binding cassette subfamily B protein
LEDPIIDVIIPLYFKDFFNTLTGNDAQNVIVKNLISILIIIASLKLLGMVLLQSAEFLSVYFQSKIIADLSNKCFAYLHKHSFSFFENSFVGSLVKQVKCFTQSFEKIIDLIIWNFLQLIIKILVIIIVLFNVNLFFAIGVIIWIIVF